MVTKHSNIAFINPVDTYVANPVVPTYPLVYNGQESFLLGAH